MIGSFMFVGDCLYMIRMWLLCPDHSVVTYCGIRGNCMRVGKEQCMRPVFMCSCLFAIGSCLKMIGENGR